MIQSFNGLTVILDGKFSFYSYIIIKKWKMRISDILPILQILQNDMYIEIIKGSAIVVISPKTELNLVNFVKHVLP